MNKDYFKDIYTDFFGVLDNEGNKEEINKNNDYEEEYSELINKIDLLYIDDSSRNLLKNIIEYMRKYSEKIETNYIPFQLIIESNIKEDITDILLKAVKKYNYIENLKYKELSFYKYDKNYEFQDNFLVLKDINGISLEDIKETQRFFLNFENYLKIDNKKIVIIEGTRDSINSFFLGHETIKNIYFDFQINSISPSITDIYNNVLEKVKDENLQEKILTYIEKTYKTGSDYKTYIQELVNYINFNKNLPLVKENKSLDEIFKDLNELIGLNDVKKVLYELVDVLKLKEKTKGTLDIKEMNLHMVFLGNPGTGKTTIARLISNILYDLGIIKENKLVEVGVKDLVAEYVGQTAPKTNMVIEKSLNGVLFIDEAYALATSNNNSYNAEAIATLIQGMENYRDKLVVIFAGYTKEMQDFLNSNSGIVSRIGYTLNFPDYTTDELTEIFLGMVNKGGFIIEDDAVTYLKEIIEQNRHIKNFGNARFVRNLYEKTIVKHATRVKNKKKISILKTITHDDLNSENII